VLFRSQHISRGKQVFKADLHSSKGSFGFLQKVMDLST